MIGAVGAPAHAASGVKRAQQRLNELHCDAGPVDGVYGEWTSAAVTRFQSRHGLPQTGRLDSRTSARLSASDAGRCDLRRVPAHSGSGRRIVISQRQNWVWLVDRRGTVVAQGGVIDNPAELSPGSYRSGSYCGRAARISQNRTPDGALFLDHYVRFAACGVGFHQIPRYVATGEQIHPDWLLGTNARESHGCIRLSRAMSLQVWAFTTSATPVRVV